MLPAVVGHAKALSLLPTPLPPTILISGPEGVGKRLIAYHLAAKTGAKSVDLQNLGSLTRSSAQAMLAHHSTHPVAGDRKVTVADLSASGPEALNSILKLLESPPAYSHIVLHSDRTPMLTIRSRCFQVRCGLLTEEEVAQVLARLGAQHAQEAAQASGGRVSVAVQYSAHYPVRIALQSILSALEKRDGKGLEDALHHSLSPQIRETSEEAATRLAALFQFLQRAIWARTGPIAEVNPKNWSEALAILERPGRGVLQIRSAVWTLAGGM